MLIVDDDELILKALGRILESAGYEPRCYVGADDALAAIESDAPVVIISDYMMPTMDGVTFLKQARSRFPGAVRILCTAAEDFRVALQAVNSGEVFRIISKPWHQQELLATVNQAAEAARLRRENERLTARGAAPERPAPRNQPAARGDGPARGPRRCSRGSSPRSTTATRRPSGTRGACRSTRGGSRSSSGSSEPELTVIEHGALLHDIGKIGVRDRVLLKPGPLTPRSGPR